MDRIARWRAFGLGQKTGLGINPEAPGRIPTRSWYALRYRGQFRVGFTLNMAIGEGDVTVTPLQLALAYAALGNGGTLYQPQVVRAVETSDGAVVQEFPPRIRRQIEVQPENLRRVTDALYGVVNDPTGTAFPARDPSLDIAGKTGTAQTGYIAKKEVDEPKMGWYLSQNHAWFASFAPSKAPEIAVAVLVEHGGSGPDRSPRRSAMQIVREYERLQAIRLGHTPSAKAPDPPSRQAAGRGSAVRLRSMSAVGLLGRVREHFDWTLFIAGAPRGHRRHQPLLGDERLAATATTTSSRSTGSSAAASWPRSSPPSTTATTSASATRSTGSGVVLLLLVFILGREIRGSSRWIYIGSFSFQPSEFMKLFLVIALAKYLHDDPKSEGRTLKDLVIPALIAAVPTALVLLQPDLGTALILGLVFVSICALTRIQWRSLVTLVRRGGRHPRAVFWSYGLRGLPEERITAWLNPDANILGYNWDPHHARIAIGNGGWLRAGVHEGTQNQFMFLHEQHSDFPFAVFAEDWGLRRVRGAGGALRVPRPLVRCASRRPRRTASAPCSRSASGASSSGTRSSTWGWSPGSCRSSA
jgi:hypothetical protein